MHQIISCLALFFLVQSFETCCTTQHCNFCKTPELLDNKVLSCLYSCQSEYFTQLQRVNSYFGSSDNNDLHQGCWKWSHGGLWSLIWIVGSNCVIKHTAKLRKGKCVTLWCSYLASVMCMLVSVCCGVCVARAIVQ